MQVRALGEEQNGDQIDRGIGGREFEEEERTGGREGGEGGACVR